MPEKVQSCQDDPGSGSLHPSVALGKILSAISPITLTEQVGVRSALWRVLASDLIAPLDVPSCDNAAMDGFALHGLDIPTARQQGLSCLGSSLAGHPYTKTVPRGGCARVTTGAPMPKGTDTVVIQEHTIPDGDTVRITEALDVGDNVRKRGEDLCQGSAVLLKGERLAPAEMGLIASLGIVDVGVVRRPRVAFFSTGDELCSLGSVPLTTGAIYDSNRYTLQGMLARLGVECLDLGVVRDHPREICAVLRTAATSADLVISTGGVSVGEADFVKAALTREGHMNFWKIAIKPGRPLVFGKVGESYFFGLPGNPVSVMVTFYQFVQPTLRKLAGEREIATPCFTAISRSSLKKREGRVEYQRGILSMDMNDGAVVTKTGSQGSGVLRSMAAANCFIVLPIERTTVAPGEAVLVQPFFGLV